MTDAALLGRIKANAVIQQMNGTNLDEVAERPQVDTMGSVGKFFPAGKKGNVIVLKSGRGDRETLFTLSHELGHFWAWSSGRRSSSYLPSLLKHEKRWVHVKRAASQDPAVTQYPPQQAPDGVWNAAVARACESILPPSEEIRREIFEEEERAWCFAVELLKAAEFSDLGALEQEARTALENYRRRLPLPGPEWTCSNCNCGLMPDDVLYIEGLLKVET